MQEYICHISGVVASPNHPGPYPNNLRLSETVQSDEGLILALKITAIGLDNYHGVKIGKGGCYDQLVVFDSDGTTLIKSGCGVTDFSSMVGHGAWGRNFSASHISKSNKITLTFKTDEQYAAFGWRISWIAIAPGRLSTLS